MVVVLALSSCASQSSGSSEGQQVSIQGGSLEKNIARELNTMRQKLGRKPMTYNNGLSSLAKEHSVFMSKNEGKLGGASKNIYHDGFRSRYTRAKLKYNVATMGENVAYMLDSGNVAKNTLDAWYLSPSHKKAMLHRYYETAGVGIYKKGNRYYITMLMAELKDEDAFSEQPPSITNFM